MAERAEPERVLVEAASVILGVPVRTVQALAARGEIPAAKVGRLWTFSPARLRQWLSDREAEGQRKPAKNAARPKDDAWRLPTRHSQEEYERAINRSREKERRASRKT